MGDVAKPSSTLPRSVTRLWVASPPPLPPSSPPPQRDTISERRIKKMGKYTTSKCFIESPFGIFWLHIDTIRIIPERI
jgi:hypothetical protein